MQTNTASAVLHSVAFYCICCGCIWTSPKNKHTKRKRIWRGQYIVEKSWKFPALTALDPMTLFLCKQAGFHFIPPFQTCYQEGGTCSTKPFRHISVGGCFYFINWLVWLMEILQAQAHFFKIKYEASFQDKPKSLLHWTTVMDTLMMRFLKDEWGYCGINFYQQLKRQLKEMHTSHPQDQWHRALELSKELGYFLALLIVVLGCN